MNSTELLQLATQFSAGEIAADDFIRQVNGHALPTATTNLDLDRTRRCGFPEVIYGQGKTLKEIRFLIEQLRAAHQHVLVTRLDPQFNSELVGAYPTAISNPVARTFRLDAADRAAPIGKVAVITAGTTDQPVAEEACETLAWMGIGVTRLHDVGVAGPHRLPERLPEFQSADAIVVIAGMEGALPSIVGGYVPCPVFAVPTSVGYGANLGGIAALLSMLNSCASNVAVVNIDAGFRGAYLAGLVAKRMHAPRDSSGQGIQPGR